MNQFFHPLQRVCLGNIIKIFRNQLLREPARNRRLSDGCRTGEQVRMRDVISIDIRLQFIELLHVADDVRPSHGNDILPQGRPSRLVTKLEKYRSYHYYHNIFCA